MASSTDKETSPRGLEVENRSSSPDAVYVEEAPSAIKPDGKLTPAVIAAQRRGLELPEFLRHITPEQREEMEKKLRAKIDLRLMPCVVTMYILNYIDRNNIAAARLAGLEEDLHLVGNEFQLAVSILFVSYVLMQVPSNLFLNKIGLPAVYLPTCMVIWGLISLVTAEVKNAAGLFAVRFFLGFVEAAYFPGCLYYLSCWYTRKELSLRTAMLYSGSLISGAFSGLITAGITANMDGLRGLRAWRWLFIIEGAVTMAVAMGCYFILPNFPRTTKWLSEEERQLAIWRMEEDIGEDDWTGSGEQTFWYGAKLAFTDLKTYILMVLIFGIVASGSVTNFFPTVVKTLNKGNVETLLLTTPPYLLAVLTAAFNSWHADRTGERFWHVVTPLFFAVAAFIIGVATTNTAARYFSMVIMVPGAYTGYVVSLAWISNTLPRPPAKRAAALAFINAVTNCSSIYASFMYSSNLGPRYEAAFIHNCLMAVMAICAATVLRLVLVRLNRKLDQGIYVEGAINALPGHAAEHGFRFKV